MIFDIGGAAGAYAFPLSGQGYVVHLIDPVEIHLEQAKARSAASGTTLGSITKGDARCLSAQSNSADAVLLFGPLYHLVERSDRLMALREARRILKPKGVLIAAAISRFASRIDGVARGFFRDSDFRKIVTSDLATGQHRNPTNQTAYFTTAYFHRPEELAAEVLKLVWALPDAELDGFVDALARRIASFDRRAIAAAKNLVNQVSLPSADRLLAAITSFETALTWPETQQRIQNVLQRGLQRDSDFETRWPEVLGTLLET